jgi:uncharacterized protein
MVLSEKRTNKLISEMSPYLRRHAHNEVFWYPWGEEAFEKARKENKPIFLSIGYSSCHWCHVMEKESFQNSKIGQYLNKNFVNIKVDKEERPDIDEAYLGAAMVLNEGRAGWPMSLFLDSSSTPFVAGTYFPPQDENGRLGFYSILKWVIHRWENNKEVLLSEAGQVKKTMERIYQKNEGDFLGYNYFDFAAKRLESSWDKNFGGFSKNAPKFFSPGALDYLMTYYTLNPSENIKEILLRTLSCMVKGGVYDLIAGGFSRYSTDKQWLVPHFEKMLYDNAILLSLYARAALIFKEPLFKAICFDLSNFLLSDMLASEKGGFISSIDADVNLEEGKYYSFSMEELRTLFSAEDFEDLKACLDLSEEGNYKEVNLLTLSIEEGLKTKDFIKSLSFQHQKFLKKRLPLLQYRAYRHKVSKDQKVLLGWNSLVISGFVSVYQAFNEERFLGLAMEQAKFLIEQFKTDGSYKRCLLGGKAYGEPCLEDLAYFCKAMIALYGVTLEEKYLKEAREAKEFLVENFYQESSAWFQTANKGEETLFIQTKEASDPVVPSPALMAFECLCFFASLDNNETEHEMIYKALFSLGGHAKRLPEMYLGYYNLLFLSMTDPLNIDYEGKPEDNLFKSLGKWSLHLRQPLFIYTKLVKSQTSQLKICNKNSCLGKISSSEDLEDFFKNFKVPLGSLKGHKKNESLSNLASHEEYFKQFPSTFSHTLKALPWKFSRISMGCYRIQNELKDFETLKNVLSSGINLFDTSNNYGGGQSELLIGKVIDSLKKEGKFKREEILIFTKAGYVQGDLLELRKGLDHSYECCELSDDHWHSLDTEYLEMEIKSSQDRLGIKTIDGFFLHNPEYLLEYFGEKEFYKKISEAFNFLEEKVLSKDIAFYGVSSNTLAVSRKDKLFVDVEKLLEEALKIKGQKHHFRLLQFPFNLIESQAHLSSKFNGGNLFQFCNNKGIATFVNRPLNAIFKEKLIRLSSISIPKQKFNYDKELMKFRYLENIWRSNIAPNIKTGNFKKDLKEIFTLSDAIEEQVKESYSEESWRSFEEHIFDYALHNLNFFDKRLQVGDPQTWLDFKADYISTLQSLCYEAKRTILLKNEEFVEKIEGILDLFLSDDQRSLSLSTKILWLLSHVKGLGSILNGIRKEKYLEEVKDVLKLPLNLPFNQILQEIQKQIQF